MRLRSLAELPEMIDKLSASGGVLDVLAALHAISSPVLQTFKVVPDPIT